MTLEITVTLHLIAAYALTQPFVPILRDLRDLRDLGVFVVEWHASPRPRQTTPICSFRRVSGGCDPRLGDPHGFRVFSCFSWPILSEVQLPKPMGFSPLRQLR